MSNVKVTNHAPEWEAKVMAVCEKSLAKAAADVHRYAQANAPHKTGALWRSIRDEPKGPMSFTVSANTPYARRWEFNEPFTDSRGRNYGVATFHGGGGSRYMRNAGRAVLPIWAAGSSTYWSL